MHSIRHLTYPDSLRDLGLKFHRLREDLISFYKNFNGKAGMKEALGIGDRQVLTRVHQFPIFRENRQNKYRRNFLTACLQLLEQAPSNVVGAGTLNEFKSRLNAHCAISPLLYDHRTTYHRATTGFSIRNSLSSK